MVTLEHVDEAQRWIEFGHWMVAQRDRLGLRRRDAARRAKVSEALWRDLETGRKEPIGAIRLLPNPSVDVLKRVADALEVPVEELLRHAGRVLTDGHRSGNALRSHQGAGQSSETALAIKIHRLSERDRRAVEVLVDALMEDTEI